MELTVKKIIKTEVDDEDGFVKYLTTLESKEKEIGFAGKTGYGKSIAMHSIMDRFYHNWGDNIIVLNDCSYCERKRKLQFPKKRNLDFEADSETGKTK